MVDHVIDIRNSDHRYANLKQWVMAVSPYKFDAKPDGFKQYNPDNLIRLEDNSASIARTAAIARAKAMGVSTQADVAFNSSMAAAPSLSRSQITNALQDRMPARSTIGRHVQEGLVSEEFRLEAPPAPSVSIDYSRLIRGGPLRICARPAFSAHEVSQSSRQAPPGSPDTAANYLVEEPVSQRPVSPLAAASEGSRGSRGSSGQVDMTVDTTAAAPTPVEVPAPSPAETAKGRRRAKETAVQPKRKATKKKASKPSKQTDEEKLANAALCTSGVAPTCHAKRTSKQILKLKEVKKEKCHLNNMEWTCGPCQCKLRRDNGEEEESETETQMTEA